jgi:hypothetical protein
MDFCNIALKEWAATTQALREGRQIILLRKGGIRDAGGVFVLEHSAFWLLPNAFHQDKPLLKPEHRDLLEAPPSPRDELRLEVFARVEQVWSVKEESFEALSKGRHIWNDDYLEVRFGYKREHALECVAVRAYAAPQILRVPGDPKYFGCFSWIEMDHALPLHAAVPVLDEETHNKYLHEWRELLGHPSG